VKCRGELQLHAGEPEDFTPKLAGEHRVPIRDDGTGDIVQADDVVEECLCDGGGGVRMPQGYEVAVLGEPVDYHQDDRLAVDAGESLHEVHGDIGPYIGQCIERLEQAVWVEMLRLVAQACMKSWTMCWASGMLKSRRSH
jgi:hypothetical protein